MNTPRFWRSKNLLSDLLAPFSWIYAAAACCAKNRATIARAPLPILSIGNVTAGGAGKTPTALALAPILQALGATPHVLTRGYGSEHPLTAHFVREEDGWRQVGDEAKLLARIAPTWVGRDRLASAQAAVAEGATIAICDDALQHHRLHKDVSLLVIDGPYGVGNGRLLPAGPLRESLDSALKRCDAVVIIGEDTRHLAQHLPLPIFHAQLTPTIDAAMVRDRAWLAFAGIGRPEKFFDSLRDLGATLVATRHFPDHHAYTQAELDALRTQAEQYQATLITTEKDAIKLPPAMRDHVTVLPVGLVFDEPAAIRDFLRSKFRL